MEWLRGEKAGAKTPTVERAMKAYREHREKEVSEQTRNSNNAALVAFEERFRGRRVASIKRSDMQAMMDEMLEAGYAPSSLQTNLFAISSFFRFTGEHNPTKGVLIPESEKPEEVYAWTDGDIKRLRRAADAQGIRLWFEVALNTGARLSELVALRWSDFDPKSRTVRITRQFAHRSHRAKRLKSKVARTAVVLPDFWDWFKPEGEYVIEKDGGPLRDRQLDYAFEKLLDACDLNGPKRGVHDTRRTYGRLFLEMGGWLDELQRSLGHASIRTTEKSYGAFQGAVAAQFGVARIYGEGRLRALN